MSEEAAGGGGTVESSPNGSRSSKKRKQVEAASGPAWGAESFSAARSNAINTSMLERGKDPGFGDFGRYMSEKIRKLRDQYHGDATASFSREMPVRTLDPEVGPKLLNDTSGSTDPRNASKRLFRGISIFVDGFTTPTHQELRFLMMNHGGVFENYFSSQRVTHIICSTLPDSKIMNPRLMSRGLPIVKPEWIVDSIKENRLLPWGSYQLERIAYSDPHQKTLSAAFSGHQSKRTSIVASGEVVEGLSAAAMIPVDAIKEEDASDLNNDAGYYRITDAVGDLDDERNEARLVGVEAESSGAPKGASEAQCMVTLPSENKSMDYHRIEPVVVQIEAVDDGPVVKMQEKEKTTGGRGHSTLEDPNFVQSYFKNSRLHFIGTWRNRYQSLVSAGSFGSPQGKLNVDRTFSGSSPSTSPAIIHLDMDCFFVSVVVRNRPDLAGKPVAVCHSDSAQGTGEISSANYPARSYGIKAGMFVRSAKALCPELAIVPYDFAAYEQVADVVYSILHRHCPVVQAVSCDEAFLDVTGHPDPVQLASKIRREIHEATKCTASAGIAENILLARLATKKAKPNGQYVIQHHEVKEFMAALPLDQLPGVGWTLREKLHDHGLYTCADLQSVSKEVLQRDYGTKTGVMLWSYAQGIDDREVHPAQERKSIGAEVNWGVRFLCPDDAQQFLLTLSSEVATRMQKVSSSGRTITLKVKRRKEGVGEPEKFMGCGICDNLSRSETVGYATNSADVLLRISRQLFASLHLDVKEVRGVGLQVSRLEQANAGTRQKHNALDSWLAPPPAKLCRNSGAINQQPTDNMEPMPGTGSEKGNLHKSGSFTPSNEADASERHEQMQATQRDYDLNPPALVSGRQQISEDLGVENQAIASSDERLQNLRSRPFRSLDLPPMSQLDESVLEHLPADILAEINEARAQEQAQEDEVKQKQEEEASCGRNGDLQSRGITARAEGPGPSASSFREQQQQSKKRKAQRIIKPRNAGDFGLPPASQLDRDVLETLPEDIRAEINQAYERELLRYPPLGRTAAVNRPPTVNPSSKETGSLRSNNPRPEEVIMPNAALAPAPQGEAFHSWQQQPQQPPPRSLKRKDERFQASLQSILERANSGQLVPTLSSTLLSLGCYPTASDEGDGDRTPPGHLVHVCREHLIQYVRAVAPNNLEEVYLLLLYVKRYGSRCKFWRAVHEFFTPAAKDVIADVYGAQLAIDYQILG